MPDQSLYDRLGGVFAIAAVVDHFSDAVVRNAIAGEGSANPELREWHTQKLARLPGLKFMRTLWLCHVAGGPFEYVGTKPGHEPTSLEVAHRELEISSEEFDAVAAELAGSLDTFEVPAREKAEVLAAFAAHKGEVTADQRQSGRLHNACAVADRPDTAAGRRRRRRSFRGGAGRILRSRCLPCLDEPASP